MKKKFFLFILFCHFTLFVRGQNENICETCSKNDVFMTTENPPEYKGGLSKLYNDLNAKLALSKKINGRVFVGMLISKEGSACCFEFLKVVSNQNLDLDTTTKTALITALKELQNWQPGRQMNNAVNCSYSFSIYVIRGKCGGKR